MKKAAIFFGLIGLWACNSTTSKRNDAASYTNAPSAKIHHQIDTVPVYKSDVYKQYIPGNIIKLIGQILPRWVLPKPDTWDKIWFHQYKTKDGLANYVTADFNGDKIPDYAFVLQNDKKELGAWVLQSQKQTYKAIKLNKTPLPVEVALQLAQTGELNYIDESDEHEKPINLKQSAITIIFSEDGAETFYWKRGKFNSVITGD